MAEKDMLSKKEYKEVMSRPENKGDEPWTVLDVVKAVDSQHTEDMFGNKAKDWAHNPFKEEMHAVDLAMEEEDPKPGYYEGRVYYAGDKPKSDVDDVEFDRDAYNLVRKALKVDADRETVGGAMNYLKKIGYYDGDLDSMKGPMFMGAGQRLITNKADDAFLDEAKEFDLWKWFTGKDK